ncbi:MAG: hypothetical protein GQ564_11465 [Bacteroidales bacterium]|nr:hypothetical protein [Bacteroidales bacterium]
MATIKKIRRFIILLLKKINSSIKIFILKKKGAQIGKRTYIGPNCKISSNSLIIGNNNTIVGNSNISGNVQIGSNVNIGSGCTILTNNHDVGPSHNALPYGTEYNIKPVVIQDNVWIGHNVQITPGVTIEEGAIVGLGSVVTKKVEICNIVGGNPAKVINYRDLTLYNELKKNKFFINDIRGKHYYNAFTRRKILKKLISLLQNQEMVKDYEIFDKENNYKVRSIMYQLYIKNQNLYFIGSENNYFFIKKR